MASSIKETTNKGGRPRKKIDKEEFEKLCALQCTKEEICAWFDLTDKTLERWCKDTYTVGFSEVFGTKRGLGKISLRRSQWQVAQKGSVAMLIWLGKQYLGQKDIQDVDIREMPEITINIMGENAATISSTI